MITIMLTMLIIEGDDDEMKEMMMNEGDDDEMMMMMAVMVMMMMRRWWRWRIEMMVVMAKLGVYCVCVWGGCTGENSKRGGTGKNCGRG